MNIHKLNKQLTKLLEENEEKTFADWYGEDLTGQTYKGDIDCSDQGLTSLKGAPEKVGGNFDCSNNNLTSLQGAPKEVDGYFDCSDNKLTNLKGAPKYVEGKFDCENNANLKSLNGIGKVNGDIYSNIKSKNKSKQASSEITLYIQGTDGVLGDIEITVDKNFLKWSKDKQLELLQTKIKNNDSEFHADIEPYNFNLMDLELDTIYENELEGTWTADYLGNLDYMDAYDYDEETGDVFIYVTFEFEIIEE